MWRKTLFLCALAFVLFSAPLAAAEGNPLADVILSGQEVHFIPRVEYKALDLSVLLPDGSLEKKRFVAGDALVYRLSGGGQAGLYTYELRLVPPGATQKSRDEAANRNAGEKPFQESRAQSGHFRVLKGEILSDTGQEEVDSPQDVLHYDDVIITGSLCVGFDCADGESFGFDTIVLKEHNLRIYFNDTSYTASYPTNSWRITINDSTNGGASYFSIDDVDDGASIFKIEAGAPANSLYVEDFGRVGLGTSTPVVELHIKDSDTPTLRLEQDSSGGWTAQTWDVAGNETNFFVRDATNGSKLPFRIQPGTPSSTLCLKSNGWVGIGTWSPQNSLHIQATGENSAIILERTDGATFRLAGKENIAQFGTSSNHDFRFMTNGTNRMAITAAGNVGIDNNTPGYKLVVGSSGAYCNGGAWVDGSSRAFKTDIRALDGDEAAQAVMNLEPVRFRYREDQTEEFLGFIAEDVPELVAMKHRKGMTAMDVVAALTKVVQQQQQTIQDQEAKMLRQEKTLARLAARLEKLEKNK